MNPDLQVKITVEQIDPHKEAFKGYFGAFLWVGMTGIEYLILGPSAIVGMLLYLAAAMGWTFYNSKR